MPLWPVLLLPALAFIMATGPDYAGQLIGGPDEPRYAAAAREMLRTGDWIVPGYNGAVRMEKPILLYWLCAGFALVFGVGPLACRLGPVLAGLGTVLVTAGLGARLYGRRAGLLAGLVLASSWYFAQIGRTVLSDMPLTFFVVSAVALLRLAAEREGLKRRRGLLLAAYVCCGLAVLAKGPVGLLLPLLIVGAWLAWEGRPFAFVGLLPLSGTLVVLAVAGPWYLAVWMRGGEAAAGLADFLGHENWDRYFHAFDHLDRPWKYVSTSIPQGMMPWTPLLPAGLLAFWRFGRRPAAPGKAAESTALCFPMVWAGAVVGFYSGTGQLGVWPWVGLAAGLFALLVVLFMRGRERHWKWLALAASWAFVCVIGSLGAGDHEPGGTRRAFYVLAAYPALALAAGWALDRLCRPEAAGSWARRLALAVPWAVALALLAVAGAALAEACAPGRLPAGRFAEDLAEYRACPGFGVLLAVAGLVALAGAAAAAFLAARGRLAAAVAATALAAAALAGCYWGRAVPMRDRIVETGELYRRAAPRLADPAAPVVAVNVPRFAEAVYYLDRPVRKLGPAVPERLRPEIVADRSPRYLVIGAQTWAALEASLGARAVVVERGRLADGRALVLAFDGAPVGPAGASP
jgi:4-amino-4-deoxy-L-arabinose transferase-like glycosyltransferase